VTGSHQVHLPAQHLLLLLLLEEGWKRGQVACCWRQQRWRPFWPPLQATQATRQQQLVGGGRQG
jgi:hypothetical protein